MNYSQTDRQKDSMAGKQRDGRKDGQKQNGTRKGHNNWAMKTAFSHHDGNTKRQNANRKN